MNAPLHTPVTPWIRMDAAWWPAIADGLSASGQAWPREAALMDLRWWTDQARMGRALVPGRRALAARWGWTERAARTLLESHDLAVVGASRKRPAAVPPMSRFDFDSAGSTYSSRPSTVPAPSQGSPTGTPKASENAGYQPPTEDRRQKTEDQQQQATLQTPTGETSPPPEEEAPPTVEALPACDAADEDSSLKEEEKPKGTPIRKAGGYLRLWKILEGAGLHTLEAVAEISRDGVAQRCAPNASVYHLDELAKILHRHGLDYAAPSAGSAGSREAWAGVVEALDHWRDVAPWREGDGWGFDGDDDPAVLARYRAGLLAAGRSTDTNTAWRNLWREASPHARSQQQRAFSAAWAGATRMAA